VCPYRPRTIGSPSVSAASASHWSRQTKVTGLPTPEEVPFTVPLAAPVRGAGRRASRSRHGVTQPSARAGSLSHALRRWDRRPPSPTSQKAGIHSWRAGWSDVLKGLLRGAGDAPTGLSSPPINKPVLGSPLKRFWLAHVLAQSTAPLARFLDPVTSECGRRRTVAAPARR